MAVGVQISSFFFVGTAILDEIFGFFRAPSSVQIQRLQLSAQQGAVGGNVTVALVDASGNALGGTVVLASGTNYKDTALPAPITLNPGATVRAKITGVDSGIGGYLTLNLIGATAQGSPAPCGCGPC
jgi:hypothetical protein